MKNIDILMVARPDHSLQIYEALLKQDNLSFLFLTFKVFPNWMRHLIKSPKAYFVNNNVKISWCLTAINFLIYKLKSPFVKPSHERNLLSSRVSRLLKKDNYKVVYYWPHYCQSAVEQFAKEHPETICIADVHLPNPSYVCETMRPVYVKYGIDPQSTHIYGQSLNTLEALVNAPAIMAPSQYVVETYKNVLPEKKYYVVDYGISVYEKYLKKNVKVVKDFVYAGGTISLEKGCDLLCEYFHYHTTYNLHLYGNVPDSQKYVFEKYKNSGNIYFHGHIPKANLQERIVQYDAGIHLSRFDAYSLSVGEMIGSGLPCCP